MKTVAFALLAAGFLAAALVAVQTPRNQVAWAHYAPALLLGVVGAALARRTRRRQSRAAATLHGNRQELGERLERIVTNARQLDREKASLHPLDVHPRIDALFRGDLEAFAAMRATIAHLHGLHAYAAVMNEFAAGERYLNRAWSASVDGYVDEVNEYLARARHQFEQTQAVLARHAQQL